MKQQIKPGSDVQQCGPRSGPGSFWALGSFQTPGHFKPWAQPEAGPERRKTLLHGFLIDLVFVFIFLLIALTGDAWQPTEGTVDLSYLYAFIHSTKQICKSLI